jgi:hypothetical protein
MTICQEKTTFHHKLPRRVKSLGYDAARLLESLMLRFRGKIFHFKYVAKKVITLESAAFFASTSAWVKVLVT